MWQFSLSLSASQPHLSLKQHALSLDSQGPESGDAGEVPKLPAGSLGVAGKKDGWSDYDFFTIKFTFTVPLSPISAFTIGAL